MVGLGIGLGLSGKSRASGAPSWVKTGAAIDWDFRNGLYYGAPLSDLAVVRTAGQTAKNAANQDVVFGANVPRITDLGLYHSNDGAETLSITSGALFSVLSGTQYSVYIDATPTNEQFTYPWLIFIGSDSDNYVGAIQLDQASPQETFEIKVATVQQAMITAVTGKAVGSARTICFAAQANNFAVSHDGAAVQTDAAGSLPSVSLVRLGDNNVPNSPINGFIRRLTVWSSRLSDANVVAVSGGSNPT